MNKSIVLISLLSAALAAAADICTVPLGTGTAIHHAKFYIEDSGGDGDFGVQGNFENEGILHFRPDGQMTDLGLAGVFFEAREPEYAE